ADLMETAFVMLEAALTARSKRADPEKIITDSLKLQGMKLATVRQLLRAPEPPKWSELDGEARNRILARLAALKAAPESSAADAHFNKLRAMVNAPALPAASEA